MKILRRLGACLLSAAMLFQSGGGGNLQPALPIIAADGYSYDGQPIKDWKKDDGSWYPQIVKNKDGKTVTNYYRFLFYTWDEDGKRLGPYNQENIPELSSNTKVEIYVQWFLDDSVTEVEFNLKDLVPDNIPLNEPQVYYVEEEDEDSYRVIITKEDNDFILRADFSKCEHTDRKVWVRLTGTFDFQRDNVEKEDQTVQIGEVYLPFEEVAEETDIEISKNIDSYKIDPNTGLLIINYRVTQKFGTLVTDPVFTDKFDTQGMKLRTETFKISYNGDIYEYPDLGNWTLSPTDGSSPFTIQTASGTHHSFLKDDIFTYSYEVECDATATAKFLEKYAIENTADIKKGDKNLGESRKSLKSGMNFSPTLDKTGVIEQDGTITWTISWKVDKLNELYGITPDSDENILQVLLRLNDNNPTKVMEFLERIGISTKFKDEILGEGHKIIGNDNFNIFELFAPEGKYNYKNGTFYATIKSQILDPNTEGLYWNKISDENGNNKIGKTDYDLDFVKSNGSLTENSSFLWTLDIDFPKEDFEKLEIMDKAYTYTYSAGDNSENGEYTQVIDPDSIYIWAEGLEEPIHITPNEQPGFTYAWNSYNPNQEEGTFVLTREYLKSLGISGKFFLTYETYVARKSDRKTKLEEIPNLRYENSAQIKWVFSESSIEKNGGQKGANGYPGVPKNEGSKDPEPEGGYLSIIKSTSGSWEIDGQHRMWFKILAPSELQKKLLNKSFETKGTEQSEITFKEGDPLESTLFSIYIYRWQDNWEFKIFGLPEGSYTLEEVYAEIDKQTLTTSYYPANGQFTIDVDGNGNVIVTNYYEHSGQHHDPFEPDEDFEEIETSAKVLKKHQANPTASEQVWGIALAGLDFRSRSNNDTALNWKRILAQGINISVEDALPEGTELIGEPTIRWQYFNDSIDDGTMLSEEESGKKWNFTLEQYKEINSLLTQYGNFSYELVGDHVYQFNYSLSKGNGKALIKELNKISYPGQWISNISGFFGNHNPVLTIVYSTKLTEEAYETAIGNGNGSFKLTLKNTVIGGEIRDDVIQETDDSITLDHKDIVDKKRVIDHSKKSTVNNKDYPYSKGNAADWINYQNPELKNAYFEIFINKEGELLNNGLDLEIEDLMGADLILIPTSLWVIDLGKLEKGFSLSEAALDENEWSYSISQEKNKESTLRIFVPDGKRLVISYWTKVIKSDGNSTKESWNHVKVKAKIKANDSTEFFEPEANIDSGATSGGVNDNSVTLNLYKVTLNEGIDKEFIYLSGAEFELAPYDLLNGDLVKSGNSSVKIIKDKDGVIFKKLEKDKIYLLRELKAPEGYIKGDPIWIIFRESIYVNETGDDLTDELKAVLKASPYNYEIESNGIPYYYVNNPGEDIDSNIQLPVTGGLGDYRNVLYGIGLFWLISSASLLVILLNKKADRRKRP